DELLGLSLVGRQEQLSGPGPPQDRGPQGPEEIGVGDRRPGAVGVDVEEACLGRAPVIPRGAGARPRLAAPGRARSRTIVLVVTALRLVRTRLDVPRPSFVELGAEEPALAGVEAELVEHELRPGADLDAEDVVEGSDRDLGAVSLLLQVEQLALAVERGR